MIENASWGRRILALLVDWLLSTLVTIAIFGLDEYTKPGSFASGVVLGVFVVESGLLTWLGGGSAGKGGNGGVPGGGGGGGGSALNGTASGAGGAGGRGEIRIIAIG